MKVALFGGSFNPPHIGHTIACYYLLEIYNFDKIWIIPCYEHPFNKEIIDFEDRYEMCIRAFKIFKGKVLTTTIEYERKGTSFTIDTVSELKRRCPQIDFSLVIGDDLIPELDKWKDINKLRKMVDFVILPRNDKIKNSCIIPPVSGSNIREMVKSGKKIDKMVPHSVADYIQKKRLYKRG